ncbi:MAG: flagellar biosynthetic protein FliR, partial [Alphaproteobacteria bacterium]|nr:flagellar biosynthetic protein FliR [Alphaproteobacteria bacterium]
SGHVFAFMMVFSRLGSGMMMFPGFGEAFVSSRIRMMFALSLSFLVYPVVMPLVPAMPASPAELIRMMGVEILVGLFFGSVMRLIMDITETAGAVIGMELGLSNAMMLNPTLGAQSALPAAFLGTAAVVLLFITGLDHLLFRALMDTYKLFPVGLALPLGDMAQTFTSLMARCFTVAIQLSSPFMVMGLLAYVAIGIMQKLMPQIQLFLIVLPAQIWGGLFVFSLCVAVMLEQWLRVYDQAVVELFVR